MDLNFLFFAFQSLDGRSIRVDEAGKGGRQRGGYAGNRGGGRFGGGNRGQGGRGYHRGGNDLWTLLDFCLIPLLSSAISALFMKVVNIATGATEEDKIGAMTDHSAEAVAVATGGTAAAVVDTEVAAADTPAATEIIGRGQKLNLHEPTCSAFFVCVQK